MVSMSPVFSSCCTAYRDRYYVLGVTVSEEGDYVFAAADVKTRVQYGDVVRITVSSSEGGSVDRKGTVKSFVGAEETFSLIPEEGYKVGMIPFSFLNLFFTSGLHSFTFMPFYYKYFTGNLHHILIIIRIRIESIYLPV